MTAPKDHAERLDRILNAWENLAPEKTFGGMTLEDFKNYATPSFTHRDRIQDLEAQLIAAKANRDHADTLSLEKCQLVINGVIGEPTEGPDSDIYQAMGFIRKSQRRSGLTRKKTSKTAE